MLDVNVKDVTKVTAGMLVQNYFADLEAKKTKNISEFRELITLCYTDNSYLAEEKISTSGKSVKPACYVKFEAPFDRTSFKVLDIKGKEIELSSQSAIASKNIIKIFRDFDEDDIKDVRAAIADEDLALIIEAGEYLIYPTCLEEKAKRMMLKSVQVETVNEAVEE